MFFFLMISDLLRSMETWELPDISFEDSGTENFVKISFLTVTW